MVVQTSSKMLPTNQQDRITRGFYNPMKDRSSPEAFVRFRKTLPIPLSHFVVYLLSTAFLYLIIVTWEKQLPTALRTIDESSHKDRFIAERAMNHLKNLTALGPRPTGSFENEVLAVKFFTREINHIMSKANKTHRILTDFQKVSGAFTLTFLDGMTNVYKNVQNIIVKIGPPVESQHSLLINCHFDTVMDSPGGSDDGASCVIMLEILRVLSKYDKPLKHNIIFLFNGAEENFMQASHGFITQHKWAKTIRAFINLEACGAGGREILFQAGPENPWLLQLYAESVPYPLASTLAQEIFQSGIVPGDTDYRIFRDFGRISGLDFAWSFNGYVYHTKLDNIHQIPLGTLQRTGDNILSLVTQIANSHQLANVEKYKKGNLVFFDFFGAFIVYGPEVFAACINVFVVLFSLYTIWWNRKHSHREGIHKNVYVKKVVQSMGMVLTSWLVTLLTVACIAFSITTLDRALSWYSRQLWLLFLYIIPTFMTSAMLTLYFSKKLYLMPSQFWLAFRIYNDGTMLIATLISIVLILFRIRSVFVISIWLLFSCISWLMREKIFPYWRDHRWLWLHTGCLLLPYILTGYVINAVIQLVVPLMGRSGSGNHAELVFSLIMSTIFVLLFSIYVPIVPLVQNVKRLIKGLLTISLVSLLVLVFTPFGFPYSGDVAAPSPQRFIIGHVERTFHDIHGRVRANSSGLWIVNLDVNSPRSVYSIVPEMTQAVPITDDCVNELYCGLPYMIPVLTIMWKNHWVKAPPPALPSPLELRLTYKDRRLNDIIRLSFSVIGPDHINLFLSPYPGVELKGWSLLAEPPLKGPTWKGQPTYYVYYSHGSEPEPWNFWVDLQVTDKDAQAPMLELGVAGHFVHGAYQTTPYLKRFLAQFPVWTTTSGWTSAYKAYTF